MIRRTLAAVFLAFFSAGAFAQGYPNRPIHLVVGFTPGGVSDVLSRAISAKLSQNLGQQVVVDNRPGAGTIVHLAGESFKTMAGVDLLHVPYKGSAPATVAVIAGEVAFIFSTMPAALPHVKSGKLRALAVTTPARVAAVQDIPTLAEAALPGFDLVLYSGLIGPAGMAREVVERANAEFAKAVNSTEIRDFFATQGATPITCTPEQFAAHMRTEVVKLGKMVRDSGAKAD